jgi:hypothetical protein
MSYTSLLFPPSKSSGVSHFFLKWYDFKSCNHAVSPFSQHTGFSQWAFITEYNVPAVNLSM